MLLASIGSLLIDRRAVITEKPQAVVLAQTLSLD